MDWDEVGVEEIGRIILKNWTTLCKDKVRICMEEYTTQMEKIMNLIYLL
jgi:hypothetical protein